MKYGTRHFVAGLFLYYCPICVVKIALPFAEVEDDTEIVNACWVFGVDTVIGKKSNVCGW
jgi:hypothetical protein